MENSMNDLYIHNNNNNTPRRPKNDGFFDMFIALYLTLNGIATGGTIRSIRDMVNNGYDRETMIATLLYLMAVIYTAQRAYNVYQEKRKNNKNNEKQR